jgi:hypothetical protein
MRHTKLMMAALTAALVFSALVATASARNGLRPSPTSVNATITSLILSSPAANVSCPVTLGFSLHSTIAKVERTLAGFLNRVSVGGCTDSVNTAASARALTETLPWHVRYRIFLGTLPNITGVELEVINTQFLVRIGEPFGGNIGCLYRATLRGLAGTNPATRLTLPRQPVTFVTQLERGTFTECPRAAGAGSEPELEGIFTLTTPVTITLI